jgi:hypothetical protein
VAYAGASIRGKGTFGTELARFQAFESAARGGVSVAAAQIDGTTSDNIIVGSGPGVPSEVKVYQTQLSSSPGAVPALFFSVWRRPVWGQHRHRFRRFFDWPREHRDRSRPGQRG